MTRPQFQPEQAKLIAHAFRVIASKRASGREKDLLDLHLLERFREKYERLNSPKLRTAAEAAHTRPKES